jgi:hypothetical protein
VLTGDDGATILIITTLSITTLSRTTLSRTTLSITILSLTTLRIKPYSHFNEITISWVLKRKILFVLFFKTHKLSVFLKPALKGLNVTLSISDTQHK